MLFRPVNQSIDQHRELCNELISVHQQQKQERALARSLSTESQLLPVVEEHELDPAADRRRERRVRFAEENNIMKILLFTGVQREFQRCCNGQRPSHRSKVKPTNIWGATSNIFSSVHAHL